MDASIRKLVHALTVTSEESYELAGCVDILSRDLARCNKMRALILPLKERLLVVATEQLNEWNEVYEATILGAEFMSKAPDGSPLAPTTKSEVVTRQNELRLFLR